MIDVYAAGIVKEIYRMKLSGMSQTAIANAWNKQGVLSPMEYKHSLGIRIQDNFKTHEQAEWSAMSVKRIFGNEVYTGTLVQRLLGIDTRDFSERGKGISIIWTCGLWRLWGNDDQTGCSGRRKGICLCLLDSYGAGFSAVQAAVEAAKGKSWAFLKIF